LNVELLSCSRNPFPPLKNPIKFLVYKLQFIGLITYTFFKFSIIIIIIIIIGVTIIAGGFGGLGVACWPLVPKFAGSNPAEAVGFFKGEKNPQHAFLRRGSKAVGPMS